LVIEGPPGIGKRRLLTEVMALADKSGVRTLFGEAFEYQQTVPFFLAVHGHPARRSPGRNADALRRLGGSADLRYLGGARSGRRDSCRRQRRPAGDCAGGHPLGR
jgi:hypothetical protein